MKSLFIESFFFFIGEHGQVSKHIKVQNEQLLKL